MHFVKVCAFSFIIVSVLQVCVRTKCVCVVS